MLPEEEYEEESENDEASNPFTMTQEPEVARQPKRSKLLAKQIVKKTY